MLAFERWTLTHSLGWAAVLVGLGLALALLLGLAALNASRVAETVAVGELCDDDGDAEPVWDGEPVGDVDAADDDDGDDDDDGEPDPALALALDGGGEAGVLLEVLPDVGEADVEDGDGDGDGEGDFVGGTVGGVGVGVVAVGSTAQVVSVFALALADVLALALADVLALVLAVVVALALADVLALDEAAPAFTVPARAAPGQPASTPRVRDPPATRLSTAARTCARRMKTALSPLLFEVTVCSLWGS
jgi:hypothetical protein